MAKSEVRAIAGPEEKQKQFREELARHWFRIAPLVPKGVTAERIHAVAMVAMSRSPLLLQCWTPSVIRGIAQGAQLGLDVSGVGGQGHLVPFKNNKKGGRYEAVFIPGYQGLIDLARRSRDVVTVRAKEVYEKDDLVYEEGVVPVLRHKPYAGPDPGKLVAAYAVAHFTNGFAQPEVMLGWQIEKVQRHSRAGDSGPWKTDPAMMWRKTAVRRLCKYLPQNPDLARAMDMEDAAETGEIEADAISQLWEEEEPAIETSTTDEIKSKLGVAKEPELELEREPGEEG